jgi:hypothetical protein
VGEGLEPGADRQPERNASRTVLRASFKRRAIALTPNPSAQCSRRISAQSSTSITPFLPSSEPSQGSSSNTPSGGPDQKRVSFRPVIGGQFSAGGDTAKDPRLDTPAEALNSPRPTTHPRSTLQERFSAPG